MGTRKTSHRAIEYNGIHVHGDFHCHFELNLINYALEISLVVSQCFFFHKSSLRLVELKIFQNNLQVDQSPDDNCESSW